MPASPLQTQSIPFVNKGLLLKNEPGTLPEGFFPELTNLDSTQENQLNIRNGNQLLTSATDFGGASLIHTITKMHLAQNSDIRYFGDGANIWRTSAAIPAPSASPTWAQTHVGFFAAVVADPYPKQRFSGVTFNAGATGTPYQYLACPSKMLKDSGSTSSGDGSGDGTLLNKWGILPPLSAAIAQLDKVTILPAGDELTGGPSYAASGRISTTINGTPTQPSGATSGAGYYNVPVTSMVTSGKAILVGTLLFVNSATFVVVENTTPTSFSAYFPAAPSNGQTVVSSWSFAATPGTGSNTATLSYGNAIAGAEFDGMAPDYTTSDLVHVAIGVSQPTQFSDIRLRVMVGSAFNASGADYYEKSITTSVIQLTTNLTQPAITTLTTVVPQDQSGITGDFLPPSELSQDTKPVPLDPVSPNQSSATPLFTEIDIPKSDFVAVGQAGNAGFSWKNVQGTQVVAIATGTNSPTIWVSSIFVQGGFGPNGTSQNANVVVQPYSYLYTFFNQATGAESNPSTPMIDQNLVTPTRQRVALTLSGTGDPQIPTGTQGAIKIYRAGGVFSDGLYRLIGFATNPGAPTLSTMGGQPGGVNTNSVVFYDTASDASITNADLLEFDNDPPVTSTLTSPVKFIFVGQNNGVAGQFSTLALLSSSGLPSISLSDFIRNGTVITFARGTPKEEQCVVFNIGTVPPADVTVFFQYNHTDFSGLSTICADASTTANQPCPLSVSAFGSVFLAGDVNNPHVVYKSKTGIPESFPVVELATGIPMQVIVGSPSNPIVNFCEYGGGLVFLNLKNLYFMRVSFGVMESPIETPAQRGLIGRFAWCKADNEIWYVSYDGVYSWSGGQSTKRSEAIDPLFKGVAIGPYAALDLRSIGTPPVGSDVINMAYHNTKIYIVYLGLDGNYYRLVYDTIYNRWSMQFIYDSQGTGQQPVTEMYNEQDTGNLIISKAVSGKGYIYLDDTGSSDGWKNVVTDGRQIGFMLTTAGYTLGAPNLNKQFVDVSLEANLDNVNSMGWLAYYDFSSTNDPIDTGPFNPPSPAAGRHRIPFALQQGFGKEAYAMQLHFNGFSQNPLTLYSLTFHYYPLTEIQVGHAGDWDDLGYEYDKRLYQLSITYDIPSGQSVLVQLDIISGIAGKQATNLGVQPFTLIPPTNVPAGAPSRLTSNFFLNDVMIVKQVRLRPQYTNPLPMTGAISSNPVPFKYFAYSFGEFEKLPPDIVAFTPWSDYSQGPYDKYAQQIDLDVDTNFVQGTCTLQADGVNVAGPFNVTTTSENRKVNLTLPPNIKGKQFRLLNTAGPGGKFQLYNHNLVLLPADKGPVLHSFDYDDLGYTYDKKLIRMTIEYDTSAISTNVLIDTLTGTKGETLNTGAFSFTLDGPGRSLQSFNFPDGTFAKMIRVYPQADTTSFKEWKYRVDKLDYPADITLFTEYTDFGYACEKIARNLNLEINTGGVPATVQLIADGVLMQTFTVTTTSTDRSRVFATNPNLIGRLWKLEITPGTGGESQLFTWSLDFVKEPCAVTEVITYETDFGYIGWKFIKQIWLTYISPASLLLQIFRDGGQLFYTISLPPHPFRDMERFYLPALQFNSGVPVLNKSKTYNVQITSVSPFKLYLASKIEWQGLGAEQRAGYQEFPLGPETQLPVQQTQAVSGSGLTIG